MEDGCDSNRISLKSKNRINELVFNTENAIFYGKSTQFEPVDDCYYFRPKKFGRWIGAHLFEWFNKYSKEIFTLSDKYIVKFVPNLFRLGKNNRITKWKNNPKNRKIEKGRMRQFKRKCDCVKGNDGTSGWTKTDLSKSALALYLHII